MRLPTSVAVESGVAPARCSQVGVYAIKESICVTNRRAFRRTESSYTVGVIWGRPRFMKARPLPHSPARNRPARPRQPRTCGARAAALALFSLRAGDAPRLLASDEAVGCPLDQALAAIEWTAAVGIVAQDDLIHAARLGADAAAAVVERKDADQRVFIYFGPRMDAPPADPYEGTLLYDEPGVRAYIFAQRVHAIAHFLRATHGLGAVISMLGRRAPE